MKALKGIQYDKLKTGETYNCYSPDTFGRISTNINLKGKAIAKTRQFVPIRSGTQTQHIIRVFDFNEDLVEDVVVEVTDPYSLEPLDYSIVRYAL